MAESDEGTNIPERVVVYTPDGHRFAGQLLERKRDRHGREMGVLRLDSGWVTSYPMEMIQPQADHEK